MILGSTLSRYFGRNFAITTLTMFVGMCVLILLIDYIEFLRRTANIANASALLVAQTSLFRVPQIAERLMASCIQVGAMVCYLGLARRLELVVARAAGISAWQFLAPAMAIAFLFGVAATTLFNPLAASLQEKANRTEAAFFGDQPRGFNQATGYWVAQATPDGRDIINAAKSLDQGRQLAGITVFRFGDQDRFKERVEAREAVLEDGYWHLKGVRIFAPNVAVRALETLNIKTNLNRSQVLESFATPETVSFWQLQDYIASSQYDGSAAAGYRIQFHKLVSRPFLFAATVLLAGAVSLRTVRFGGVQLMVLAGVLAGFLLYVLAKIAEDLGSAELIPPIVAAWLPVAAGGLVGVMGLLYQEDG